MQFLTCACVFGLTTLMFSVGRADGVDCYFCTGAGCEDEFNSENVRAISCQGSCSKTRGKDDYVTRACTPLLQLNKCEEKDDGVHCWCNQNLCNAAISNSPSLVVLLALIAIGVAVLKLKG